MLVPNDFTRSEICLFNPFTTDEMMITVVTPITMPRMVSAERSLLERSVSRAMPTASRC